MAMALASRRVAQLPCNAPAPRPLCQGQSRWLTPTFELYRTFCDLPDVYYNLADVMGSAMNLVSMLIRAPVGGISSIL